MLIAQQILLRGPAGAAYDRAVSPASLVCPACGANAGYDRYICRKCGTYFPDGPEIASHENLDRSGGTDRHTVQDSGISIAVREVDAQYEAMLIPRLRVGPGGHAILKVRITNQSLVVDTIELSVEGVPDSWANLRPDRVHLIPFRRNGRGFEAEVEARITFPYSPEAEARPWPIRIVGTSLVQRRRVASSAAVVEVAPYAILSLELTKPSLRARRRDRTEVRIVNSGNTSAEVRLSARDDGDRLQFTITPEQLTVSIGDDALARLDGRVRRPRYFGRTETHQFHVEAVAATARRGEKASGRFDQLSYLPRWVLALPALAAVALAWALTRADTILVPSVTGMSVGAATAKLTEAGLDPQPLEVPAGSGDPATGVVGQSPRAGRPIKSGAPVKIFFEAGAGTAIVPSLDGLSLAAARERLTPRFKVGQVTPDPPPDGATISEQQPAAGERSPLGTPIDVTLVPATTQEVTIAFASGDAIYVKAPGKQPRRVAAGGDNSDPAWNTATGELAWVRRATPQGDGEILAVNPSRPASSRTLTDDLRSYTNPAFAPDGDLVTVIADDGSGYGGRLCLFAPPSRQVRCRPDDGFRYGRPAWAPDGALYALRRSEDNRSRGGWTELVRLQSEAPGSAAADAWTLETKPVLKADLLSVTVAADGRLAVLARDAGRDFYHVEVLSPEGDPTAVQAAGDAQCEVAWAGEQLLVSRLSCLKGNPVGRIVRMDPADLDGEPVPLVAGEDPAARP